jgi:hypothetical protein
MVNVIYDTGSAWLVLETHQCTGCTGGYDFTDEKSGSYEAIPDSDGYRAYGDGTILYGYQAYDTTCLSADTSITSCATDFLWFAVDDFADGFGLSLEEDGILGMSSG